MITKLEQECPIWKIGLNRDNAEEIEQSLRKIIQCLNFRGFDFKDFANISDRLLQERELNLSKSSLYFLSGILAAFYLFSDERCPLNNEIPATCVNRNVAAVSVIKGYNELAQRDF